MVGQEAAHAKGHRDVLQQYEARGFNLSVSKNRLNFIFNQLLGDRFLGKFALGKKAARRWLLARLGIVAAIEHLTCALGSWAFFNPALEKDCICPDMVQLIKWHAAEEIEHRCVAYDLYRHLGGGYLQRVALYWMVFLAFLLTWKRGTQAFLRQDPRVEQKYSVRDYRASSKRGHLPPIAYMLRASLRFMRLGFHPCTEASTAAVQDFLQSAVDSRAV